MVKLAIVSLLLFVAVAGPGTSAGVEAEARPYLNTEPHADRNSTIDIAGESPQTMFTLKSLGYDTSTFHSGDILTLDFDNPYQESSATLELHKIIDAGTTSSGSLDLQVASAGNDAYTSKNWAVLCSGEKILRLGNHSVCGQCSVFARFPGISGLGGATITDAYIEVLRNAGEGNASIEISAEDAESPAQITRPYDHRTRPRTSARVNWTGTLAGGWNRSPSIVPIIQELADNYDPFAIQILLDDDGTTPSGNSWELFTWEYGAHDRGIKLHIEYEPAGDGAASSSSEDYAQLFISNTYIATVPFSSSEWETVEVPTGVLEQGSNTIKLEFVGPSAKTLVEDSTIDIAQESPI